MSKVDPLQGKYTVVPNGCWEWIRAKQGNGYGSVGFKGRIWLAHRLAYVFYVGPIPEGHDIHHVCGNRACINPAHLQPILPARHALLTDNPFTRNAAKTHCPKGHEYTLENTIIRHGNERNCRICYNEARTTKNLLRHLPKES